MRKLVLSAVFALMTIVMATAQDVTARPTLDNISGEEIEARKSPMGSSILQKGDTYLRIVYNQPSLKGRKMLGKNNPYGKVWRLGANEATEIFLNKTIKVDGKKLKKGAYSMFCIPNKDNWVVIFSKDLGLRGTGSYNADNDAFRVTVPVKAAPKKFETFFIWFGENGNELHMAWDDAWVTLPIEVK